MDLAVSDLILDTTDVKIFLGNGDGTFTAGVSYNIGDFTGEKKLSVAVTNFSSNQVGVLIGRV